MTDRLTEEQLRTISRDRVASPERTAAMAAELLELRARIAEMERAVEGQVSEIADKGEAITRLRDQLRGKGARIAELERDNAALRLRLEPPESLSFDVLLRELGVDMTAPAEILAEKVVQQRERIAELKAALEEAQRPPLGYVVGRQGREGWGFARFYGGPERYRAKAEQELASELEEGGPDSGWKLLEVREVQP
ncbi:hypothetical protein [Nocardia sp. NPDC057440]|uniref:hypothetical protein n=1 Tax=Nocardia sp. NPDC057440 TaxID=3346134 RepID=UPI00366DEE26